MAMASVSSASSSSIVGRICDHAVAPLALVTLDRLTGLDQAAREVVTKPNVGLVIDSISWATRAASSSSEPSSSLAPLTARQAPAPAPAPAGPSIRSSSSPLCPVDGIVFAPDSTHLDHLKATLDVFFTRDVDDDGPNGWLDNVVRDLMLEGFSVNEVERNDLIPCTNEQHVYPAFERNVLVPVEHVLGLIPLERLSLRGFRLQSKNGRTTMPWGNADANAIYLSPGTQERRHALPIEIKRSIALHGPKFIRLRGMLANGAKLKISENSYCLEDAPDDKTGNELIHLVGQILLELDAHEDHRAVISSYDMYMVLRRVAPTRILVSPIVMRDPKIARDPKALAYLYGGPVPPGVFYPAFGAVGMLLALIIDHAPGRSQPVGEQESTDVDSMTRAWAHMRTLQSPAVIPAQRSSSKRKASSHSVDDGAQSANRSTVPLDPAPMRPPRNLQPRPGVRENDAVGGVTARHDDQYAPLSAGDSEATTAVDHGLDSNIRFVFTDRLHAPWTSIAWSTMQDGRWPLFKPHGVSWPEALAAGVWLDGDEPTKAHSNHLDNKEASPRPPAVVVRAGEAFGRGRLGTAYRARIDGGKAYDVHPAVKWDQAVLKIVDLPLLDTEEPYGREEYGGAASGSSSPPPAASPGACARLSAGQAESAALCEARVYSAFLSALQGTVVPHFLGLYRGDAAALDSYRTGTVRGPLVLVLSDAGEEYQGEPAAVLESYRRLHAQGVVHGDVRRSHLRAGHSDMRRAAGDVAPPPMLIDFETARFVGFDAHGRQEVEREMDEVRRLVRALRWDRGDNRDEQEQEPSARNPPPPHC